MYINGYSVAVWQQAVIDGLESMLSETVFGLEDVLVVYVDFRHAASTEATVGIRYVDERIYTMSIENISNDELCKYPGSLEAMLQAASTIQILTALATRSDIDDP